MESYASTQQSFNEEVKKLVGLHQPRARKEEYRLYEEQAKIELNREEVKESQVKLPPQVDFDALFIPDYAKTIGQIAPTLAYYDIEHMALLGTQGWHSPKLLERGREYVEGAVFADGFFKDSADEDVKAFVNAFEWTFGYAPEIWEAQAYDAARFILAQFNQQDIEDRQDLQEKLNNVSEFSGVTRTVRFLDNHDIDKQLFLLTVKKGSIQAYPQK